MTSNTDLENVKAISLINKVQALLVHCRAVGATPGLIVAHADVPYLRTSNRFVKPEDYGEPVEHPVGLPFVGAFDDAPVFSTLRLNPGIIETCENPLAPLVTAQDRIEAEAANKGDDSENQE